MDIENDTDDDAKVKVSPSGPGNIPKGRRFREVNAPELSLPRGKTLTFPSPRLPWVAFFSVQNRELRREVRSVVKGLRLTEGTKGYEVRVLRNGRKT